MLIDDYNSQMMPTYENPTYTGGGSQVSEPEILNPINPAYTPPIKGNQNVEDVESGLPQGTNNTVTPNNDAEPSATTDETKTYVGGGTTPDSNIVIDKKKRNYLMYGLIGVVGVYVVYKLFFNKKSQ
jgi:hypothetical protein